MVSNKEVRTFLNKVAKKEFNKKYSLLSDRNAAIVRKKAVKIAFKKKK
jgi:hypothetical protein